jgi:ATP-dependent DNA ligase
MSESVAEDQVLNGLVLGQIDSETSDFTMQLLRTEALPEGREWLYEIKLDGYRAWWPFDEEGNVRT